MMANKRMKVFLLLGVILLSTICAGCSPRPASSNLTKEASIFDIQNIISYKHPESVQITFSFDDKINRIINLNHTFYTAELNKDKYYVVCGYIDEESLVPERRRVENSGYYDKVTWIQYSKISEVEKRYNDLIISDVYLVYDIVIKEDIVQDKSYNYTYRYYQNATYEFVNDKDTDDFIQHEDILLWYYSDLVSRDNVFFGECDYEQGYEIIYGDALEAYVIFDKQETYSDSGPVSYLLEKELGSYYSKLLEHFIDDETLTETVTLEDGSCYIIEKVRIPLNVLLDAIREKVLNGGK